MNLFNLLNYEQTNKYRALLIWARLNSYFETERTALKRGVELKWTTSRVVCQPLKSGTAM